MGIRREVMKRAALAGKLEARCSSKLTDEFGFDEATGFGKTDWRPLYLKTDVVNGPDRVEGHLVILACGFENGSFWQGEERLVCLKSGKNLYTLRNNE